MSNFWGALHLIPVGFFPHYGDVPIMISMLLSFTVIFIYTCILYTICISVKKKQAVKQDT